MLADSLRRGLAAGLVAGLLAGLFAFVVGEVPVREAIRLEQQAAASTAGTTADDPATDDETAAADAPEVAISRTTQQALLPVATAIVGAAMGGLFGLAWAVARRHVRDDSHWRASWKLGAAAWAVVALLPALVSPPNPPAVGDPATIGGRSATYLVTIVAGVLGAALVWWLARRLRHTGLPEMTRQATVGGVAVTLLAVVLVAMPANTDPIEVPARLLWQFRLASITTQLVLWAGIAGVHGWLWQRATTTPVPATATSAA